MNKRPPYGPTEGLLQTIELLQTSSPSKVDVDLLKAKHIAKGNEYKVVAALRFLELIDDNLRPTENASLLHLTGNRLTAHLQKIVRNAYEGVFANVTLAEARPEDFINYFVEGERLPPAVASKAARCFGALARLAKFEIGTNVRPARQQPSLVPGTPKVGPKGRDVIGLILSSQVIHMNEAALTLIFRKVLRAWRIACREEGEQG